MAVDALIVGAGMAGLMAARTLLDRGYSARLVDMSRSVGGRMATRRVGDGGVADHGAQFFTVRSEALGAHVERWLERDWASIWGYGWSDGSTRRAVQDGHPRYIASGGMNRLAKRLSQGLDVTLNQVITRVEITPAGWAVQGPDGQRHESRALLLTPPAPQSRELLAASKINLHPEDIAELGRIRFGPCLCGIHEIDGEIVLPEPGALQDFQSDVYWVADNQAKGISRQAVVTSHANAKFSRQNWDAPEADIIRQLEGSVKPYLAPGAVIQRSQLKKWRYSVPLTTYPHECLLARDLPPLAFAGDAFGGRGRIEGAFLSGIAAGEALAEALNRA